MSTEKDSLQSICAQIVLDFEDENDKNDETDDISDMEIRNILNQEEMESLFVCDGTESVVENDHELVFEQTHCFIFC